MSFAEKKSKALQSKALKVLEIMYLSRFIDEKTIKLVKQNKGGTFQLSAAGHEMVGAVAGQALTAGKDWALPYYRDQPLVVSLGCSAVELLAGSLARAGKHHSAGRMMPVHYSHKELRIACQSSCVGSQFLQAAGLAKGLTLSGKDEVVYVSAGDGATSQGDFHEAVNFSSIHKLPVIFSIQDNGWAISVPICEQTTGGSIVPILEGYHGLEVHAVDGTDYEAVSHAFKKAVERGRKGKGPSAVISKVPRLAAHSSSDDPRKYRSDIKVAQEKELDPILRMEQWVLHEKIATEQQLETLRNKCSQEVDDASIAADALPHPAEDSVTKHVFADFEAVDFGSERAEGPAGEKIVMVDALNHALDEEMTHNPGVVVFGQDVAHGKGGVFGVTANLTKKHGKRCFNTPLAESTIIGLALGMSLDGVHHPVAEIQFADYVWTGINQLFNEVASLHYRANGEWKVPLVIRMPCGGYIQGGPYHSQSIEGFLSHCPGLKVVIPSNAADAKGLFKMAMRDPNPVIFLEHKALYRQQVFSGREEPPSDYLIPFGQAKIVREGSDATIVAWGMTVLMALEAAERLSKEGVSVEVIDIRTIVPLDIVTILTSVRKTGKLLVAHEAPRNCGFGAEVVARVAEQAFEYLDAPIMRVCGLDVIVSYSKVLENKVLPQVADIERTLRQLCDY